MVDVKAIRDENVQENMTSTLVIADMLTESHDHGKGCRCNDPQPMASIVDGIPVVDKETV
jgi:hypothetical protein